MNDTQESLITVVAPSDIVGAITAGFHALASLSDTMRALSQDQSPEGRAALRFVVELAAIPTALLTKLNRKLHIDPLVDDAEAPKKEIVVTK
jgi:hypothetical protein